MAPKLSLAYRGTQASGPLGVGWTLEGLSEIRRCARSMAVDGTTDGVNHTPLDAFCLDGQRLIRLTPDGTEYRTEQDAHARIRYHAVGDAAKGIADDSFVVETRSGLVKHLRGVKGQVVAASAKEIIPAPSLATAFWALSKVEDEFGNRVVYEYKTYTDPTSPPRHALEYLIDTISYTLRPDELPADGRRKVHFVYEERPDASFAYVDGVRTELNRRLKAVEASAPDPSTTAPVWTYVLDYEVKSADQHATSRSLLASVRRCDPTVSTCLWAKQFTYSEGGGDVVVHDFPHEWTGIDDAPDPDSGHFAASHPPPAFVTFDADGDGRQDVLYSTDSGKSGVGIMPSANKNLTLRLGSASGPLADLHLVTNQFPHWVELGRCRPVDVDRDGQSELYVASWGWFGPSDRPYALRYQLFDWDPGTNQFNAVGPAEVVATFVSNAPEDLQNQKPAAFDPVRDYIPTVLFLDLDGDGYLDKAVSAAKGEGWRIQWNDGGSFGVPVDVAAAKMDWAYVKRTRGTDVDGDGRAELLVPLYPDGANGNLASTIAIGTDDAGGIVQRDGWGLTETLTPDYLVSQLAAPVPQLVLADVNGDGLLDAVTTETSTIRWNTGRGFGPAQPLVAPDGLETDVLGLSPGGMADQGVRPIDANGDGRSDLLIATRHGLYVYVSRGQDLVPYPSYDSAGAYHDRLMWSGLGVADYTGDGRPDVLSIHHGALRVVEPWRGDADLLLSVKNELHDHDVAQFTYERRHVAPTGTCAYPVFCGRGGFRTVKELAVAARESVIGMQVHRVRFWYTRPRIDLLGRGFIGYEARRKHDLNLLTDVVEQYDLSRVGTAYPYAGTPKEVRTATPIFPVPEGEGYHGHPAPVGHRARVLTLTNNLEVRWSNPVQPGEAGKVYFTTVRDWTLTRKERDMTVMTAANDHEVVFPGGSVSSLPDQHGGPLVVDDYGNLLSDTTSTDLGAGSRFVRQYHYDLAKWKVVGLEHEQRYAWDFNGFPEALVDEVHVDRDAMGRIEAITRYPGWGPAYESARTVEWADDGLLKSSTLHASGEPARKLRYFYDPDRVFVRQVGNDLNQFATRLQHPAYGFVILERDANQVDTRWTWDQFGRPQEIIRPGGAITSFDYEPRIVNGAPAGLVTTVLGNDGSQSRMEHNDLEQETLASVWDPLGQEIKARTSYDLAGNAVRRSRPGLTPSWVEAHAVFDTLGRVVESQDPGFSPSTYEQGFTITTRTDPMGFVTKVFRDADDRIVRKQELLDGKKLETKYEHSPFGIWRITDAADAKTWYEFDLKGRVRLAHDPNTGVTETQRNAFDEVIQTTNALNQISVASRDVLGRVTSYTTVEGKETFDYDLGPDGEPHARGKLVRTESPTGVIVNHHYDAQGRPAGATWRIRGETFDVAQTYDPLGRLDTVLYPEVPGRAKRFTIQHAYDAWGYPLTRQEPGNPTVRLEVKKRNVDLVATKIESGTGWITTHDFAQDTALLEKATAPGASISYKYDGRGNVKERLDGARKETFDYDDLERLETWTLTPPGAPTVVYGYDYDDAGNLRHRYENGVADFSATYANQGKPNVLASIGNTTFDVDALGRQLGGGGRSLTYTPFDLPRTVTMLSADTTTRFEYDAAHRRVWKGTLLGETVYVGGLYERRTAPGSVKHVFHVAGEGASVQVVFQAGAEKASYLAADGLGSPTVVTDEQGVSQRQFFDPFGRRVDEAGVTQPSGPTDVRHGFTGHEGDDELGLVNMRGRVYDPIQMRFLTADPHRSAPYLSQGWNAFSYARNNPLNVIDPTGLDGTEVKAPPEEGAYQRTRDGWYYSMPTDHISGSSPSGIANATEASGEAQDGAKQSSNPDSPSETAEGAVDSTVHAAVDAIRNWWNDDRDWSVDEGPTVCTMAGGCRGDYYTTDGAPSYAGMPGLVPRIERRTNGDVYENDLPDMELVCRRNGGGCQETQMSRIKRTVETVATVALVLLQAKSAISGGGGRPGGLDQLRNMGPGGPDSERTSPGERTPAPPSFKTTDYYRGSPIATSAELDGIRGIVERGTYRTNDMADRLERLKELGARIEVGTTQTFDYGGTSVTTTTYHVFSRGSGGLHFEGSVSTADGVPFTFGE